MPLAASPLICIRINCLPQFRDSLTARQNRHRRNTHIERQSRWFECADEDIQKRRRQGAKPYPPLDLYQSTPFGTSWRDIPETISTRRLDLSGRIDLVSRTPFPSSPTWVRLPGHGYGHRPPVLFIVASVNDADPATALSLDPERQRLMGPPPPASTRFQKVRNVATPYSKDPVQHQRQSRLRCLSHSRQGMTPDLPCPFSLHRFLPLGTWPLRLGLP